MSYWSVCRLVSGCQRLLFLVDALLERHLTDFFLRSFKSPTIPVLTLDVVLKGKTVVDDAHCKRDLLYILERSPGEAHLSLSAYKKDCRLENKTSLLSFAN